LIKKRKTFSNPYKDLKVWQKSYKLSLAIYKITANFPNEEKYGKTGHDSLETLTPGILEPSLNLTIDLLNKG
jgi:hypothetical protein